MRTLIRLALLCVLPTGAWAFGTDEIEVMTQNQYLGADLGPILTAPDSDAFNAAVVDALQQIAANRFRERAKRQALEMAIVSPHIIALQEVYRFDCVDLAPAGHGEGCRHPSIAGAFLDQLEVTLAALKKVGAHYRVVAAVKNFDAGALQLVPGGPPGVPFLIEGHFAVVTLVDRDVMLARRDVEANPVDFTVLPHPFCMKRSLDGCNYQTVLTAPLPGTGQEITVERGFVGVDATVRGKRYRIINTHLEVREAAPGNPLLRVFQAAQAAELLATVQLTTPVDRTLLVLGDMNSSPEDTIIPGPLPLPPPFDQGIVPPYQQFVAAGFTDAWTLRRRDAPGFTCCQAEDLRNRKPRLDERIDLIFSGIEPDKVERMHLIGSRVFEKTFPPGRGLWPSDHAGVAGALEF